ncbi:unnamed protein product [Boreogadus saida]
MSQRETKRDFRGMRRGERMEGSSSMGGSEGVINTRRAAAEDGQAAALAPQAAGEVLRASRGPSALSLELRERSGLEPHSRRWCARLSALRCPLPDSDSRRWQNQRRELVEDPHRPQQRTAFKC